MEYDQRMFIQFLWNEEIDADRIRARLQAQFGQYACKFRTVRFWIAEVWFGRQDLHAEIRTGKPPLDNLDAKISAILDKSPFDSAYSMARRLRVGHATLFEHLHVSVGFKPLHLRWVPHMLISDLCQNARNMQARCCDSCILLNVIAGSILWLVMSPGFSSIHHHVDGGLCQEVMWP
jgi:hypothetical protein